MMQNIYMFRIYKYIYTLKIMNEKGKYASHGVYIKKLSNSCLAKWDKPQLATIHPLPQNKSKVSENNEHPPHHFNLTSATYSAKFKFQSDVQKKPLTQDLIQPFMYIEKVVKKQTVDQKLRSSKKPTPFITSKVVRPKTTVYKKETIEIPVGYSNLFQYEEDKRKIATKIFHKLLDMDIQNIKDMFSLWYGKGRKVTPQIDIKESQFVQFVKEMVPSKISEKQIRLFFKLYRNKSAKGLESSEIIQTISIKAFSFNYEKYRKSEIQVEHIMSEKSAKQRYLFLKNYLKDFNGSYRELKDSMNSIKNYEEAMRNHFKAIYKSYKNPFEGQILHLQKELQKPIIKYDRAKKQELSEKIQAFEKENLQSYQKLTEDFNSFLQHYEKAIISHHDLFFTKRTTEKLLSPLAQANPFLTRQLIEKGIEKSQQQKQQYLQCLSDFVVEMDEDKKHLGEDCFTLDQIVQMVLMRGKQKVQNKKYSDDLVLSSLKKFIKQIKRQFLLKNNLIADSFDDFPSNQEINLDILHTCFEMQCTKILFKNQIWNEMLNIIPVENQLSKLHQKTIDANICEEYLKRYFLRLDQRMKIQRNKSKHISLLVQNCTLSHFAAYGQVLQQISDKLYDYVEDQDQEEDKVQPLIDVRKKVGFADVVDQVIDRGNRPQYYEQQAKQQQQNQLIKSIIKSIFQSNQQNSNKNSPQKSSLKPDDQVIDQKRNELNSQVSINDEFKTMAKSFFIQDPINTSSFDIRFYEKMKANQHSNKIETQQMVRMGTSSLLQNLPHVSEIKSDDPLRISRFLLTNMDQQVKQQQRVIREKQLQSNIKQGIDHNYYQEKIKLQNKPTVFDSDGRSKYSVLFPVGYYQNFLVGENVPETEKWYLRSHHVETLTENPLSKKDNLIHTEYQSKLEKLEPKKRPDQFIIQENVNRKDQLIGNLEERINSLKKDLESAQRGSKANGAKVSTAVMNRYYENLIENKEDKELQTAAYEGVLYDLRRKERQLLTKYREHENQFEGEPGEKWWEKKDKMFNNELRKDRLLVADSLKPEPVRRSYVDKLQNKEIY